jgi:D-alanyl-D-alanine carboxypeptidase
MNKRAGKLRLRCTRFSSPHGLEDRGNHSCPEDLAALARADLANRRIRAIARTDRARLRFPIRGGYLDLLNNNPFIRSGAKRITGLKTGYTDAAGRCYVITAKRGGRHLGVVLLHSPKPLDQVPALLRAGARRG